VMISGWLLDPHGKKMSKSKGNVVEPQEVIKKHCADALRFMAAGSKLGEDLPYQEKDVITGMKTITKLWNATKFAIMNLEGYDHKKPKQLELMDKWVLSKLNKIIKESTEAFDKYEYSKTKQMTETFFYQQFCDNYMEIIKDRIYNPQTRGEEAKKAAQYSLYTTNLAILKLMAPIMPHITEATYQMYFAEKEGTKSIHNSKWPEYNEKMIDEQAEKKGDCIIEVITAVRKLKSENKMSLKQEIKKLTIECEEDLKEAIEDIKATTRALTIEFGKGQIACSDKAKISVEF
jgi:valyl-tRNA synthetase